MEYYTRNGDRDTRWDLVEYRSYGNPWRPDDGVGVFVEIGDDIEHTFPMDEMEFHLPR